MYKAPFLCNFKYAIELLETSILNFGDSLLENLQKLSLQYIWGT